MKLYTCIITNEKNTILDYRFIGTQQQCFAAMRRANPHRQPSCYDITPVSTERNDDPRDR